jgi:Predicted translation initiation factor 2B subunit, eIF-2B alpha/beta/delta family
MSVYSPAFDVTPSELLMAIVTDQGILYPPFSDSIHRLQSLIHHPSSSTIHA